MKRPTFVDEFPSINSSDVLGIPVFDLANGSPDFDGLGLQLRLLDVVRILISQIVQIQLLFLQTQNLSFYFLQQLVKTVQLLVGAGGVA